jgi:hypothetical protein
MYGHLFETAEWNTGLKGNLKWWKFLMLTLVVLRNGT